MKVMTILGTRPEIIRLSLTIEKLDHLCEHVVVHTGQNYDVNLNDILFQQLGVQPPNHFLGVKADTFGEQIGKIIAASEQVMLAEKPDRLADTGGHQQFPVGHRGQAPGNTRVPHGGRPPLL